MQEGCRALRNLCYSNRQGLEEFFKLGACDVILGDMLLSNDFLEFNESILPRRE